MANLQKVVKVTQEQYNILASGGTVGDYTGLDDNYIYLVLDDLDYLPLLTDISDLSLSDLYDKGIADFRTKYNSETWVVNIYTTGSGMSLKYRCKAANSQGYYSYFAVASSSSTLLSDILDGTVPDCEFKEYALTEDIPTSFTLVDDILDGSANKYAPYTTRSAGHLYTGTTNPSSNNRLNYDGYFYATKLYSGGAEVKTTDNDHYPTTFTWTNGTTSGPTGSLTGNSGFSAVSFGAIPAASDSQSGIVTTGAQTFAGAKNITSGSLTVGTTTTGVTSTTDKATLTKDALTIEDASIGTTSSTNKCSKLTSIELEFSDTGDSGGIYQNPGYTRYGFSSIRYTPCSPFTSSTYTLSFPKNSGTIALTTDINTAAVNNLAPEYSSSATYAVGDKVIRNGQLYKCNTAISTAESWTAAHWTAIKVSSSFVDLDTAQTISGEKTFEANTFVKDNTLVVYNSNRPETKVLVSPGSIKAFDYNGSTGLGFDWDDSGQVALMKYTQYTPSGLTGYTAAVQAFLLPSTGGTIATTNDIPTALQSSSSSSTGAIPYIEFVSIDSDGVLNLTTKYMKI